MSRNALATTACFVSLFTAFSTSSVTAQDLIWQVENPFRFFKGTRSFALHEAAFNAVRSNGPLPSDIIWRVERKLNDPDCKDPSTPDKCEATAGKLYQQSRLGWAAQTVNDTCYESDGKPRRYSPVCERKYSWGTAKEDYILPDAHTVVIQIAPQLLAGVTGDCFWAWPSPFGCPTAVICATARSWSRICSWSRSAIRSRPARATRTGRCSSAPHARWSTIPSSCVTRSPPGRRCRRRLRRAASASPRTTIRSIPRSCRGG